jgi:hypothetical protein
VTVNNPTNINKTNNRFSPQINEHIVKTTTYDVENPGPGMGHAESCGEVKLVNRIPTLSFFINGSPTPIQI